NEMLLRIPISGGAGCCAHAAIGHAAAPPRSVMNPRRLIRLPEAWKSAPSQTKSTTFAPRRHFPKRQASNQPCGEYGGLSRAANRVCAGADQRYHPRNFRVGAGVLLQ